MSKLHRVQKVVTWKFQGFNMYIITCILSDFRPFSKKINVTKILLKIQKNMFLVSKSIIQNKIIIWQQDVELEKVLLKNRMRHLDWNPKPPK
jgi:hypothetical protein